MIIKNLSIGDVFEDYNRYFKVLKVVERGYESEEITEEEFLNLKQSELVKADVIVAEAKEDDRLENNKEEIDIATDEEVKPRRGRKRKLEE